MSNICLISVKVDSAGRVTIPATTRRILDIKLGEYVCMSSDGECIKIFKHDKEELRRHIKYIEGIANDSENITITEYKQLCEIMNKLEAGGAND